MSSNYGAKVHIKETFPWREMFHAYAENYQTYFFLYSFFFLHFIRSFLPFLIYIPFFS